MGVIARNVSFLDNSIIKVGFEIRQIDALSQVNYEEYIDAMKKELELKLQLKQRVFEFNSSLAKLNKSAGIPLTTLITN